ncbi:MAG: TonB family protein, partial [Crocinitomicaceae bacterium]
LECGAYVWPEVPAEYSGGVLEMKKFVASNLKYSERLHDYHGTIYASFEVEKDGCITHAESIRSVSEEMDREAHHLVRSMPKWIPAKNNGKIVAARVQLPIRFSLN